MSPPNPVFEIMRAGIANLDVRAAERDRLFTLLQYAEERVSPATLAKHIAEITKLCLLQPDFTSDPGFTADCLVAIITGALGERAP